MYEEEDQQEQKPKRNTKGKKKIVVPGEGEYENKNVREKSIFEQAEAYDIVKDMLETQVHATFAQMIQDPKQAKKLRDAIKRKTHVELAEIAEEY